ncbi:OVARIAN TUMOR DOMAIN-containing deubiquitinating enzyme 1 isoform X2 [Elaeis guineensis]|uniref:OVARIAN TUMOR DOMAIN-containing deubiquitinating enzyme 1 isoform X2 n=1 Tax=Elaeis guineensis var. tenera TaxID=51953 RepID=UPI003C6D4891
MEKLLSDQEPAVGESSASWSNPNPNPTSVVPMDDFDWSSIRDDDIMQQHSAIRAEEAVKVPFVGDKEPLSSLAAEFQSGNPILKEKIKLLGEQYGALRRTRGDGNCFYRSFMFSYLEHILETQDKVEVDRILENIEECKKTLQGLGYIEFTFEDFFSIFIEQLESVLLGNETSISHEELLQRSRDQMISDYVVMFFRFVTSGEIRKRSEFFEPFIAGLTNSTVDQFCKASVEPMGEESDHVHITALSDALGVPIRVVYLDRSSCDSGTVSINHHDFVPSSKSPQEGTAQSSEVKTGHPVTLTPTPFVTLLYRPGHYDILYPK